MDARECNNGKGALTLYEDITLLRLVHSLLIRIHQTKTPACVTDIYPGDDESRAERACILSRLGPRSPPPCPCPRGSRRLFQVSCLVSGIRSLVRHGSVNRDLRSDRVLTNSLANLSTKPHSSQRETQPILYCQVIEACEAGLVLTESSCDAITWTNNYAYIQYLSVGNPY
jgi:hypothetical protein